MHFRGDYANGTTSWLVVGDNLLLKYLASPFAEEIANNNFCLVSCSLKKGTCRTLCAFQKYLLIFIIIFETIFMHITVNI